VSDPATVPTEEELGDYVPNTTPVTPVRGGHRDGIAVVGGPHGFRPAPTCMLIFECPLCHVVTKADAYRGVVACGACPTRPFMVPKAIA
jgi:hypothetical protein